MTPDDYEKRIAALEQRLAALEQKPVDVAVQTASFRAQEGQHCIVEAPPQGLNVVLPHARPQNRNKRITFTLRNGNPVRFTAVDSKINNRSSGLMTLPGTFDAISDGLTGWGISALAAGPSATGTALDAGYLVDAADPSLPNARVATDSTEIDADTTVPNVVSWALKAASVVFSKLQDLAGLSVLGRAANSAGVMAAITATAARQALMSDAAGTSIGWRAIATADVPAHPWSDVLTSGANSGASNPIVDAGQFLGFGALGGLPASGTVRAASSFQVNSVGSMDIISGAGAYIGFSTNSTARWYIASNGAWQLGGFGSGFGGTSGQYIKSTGGFSAPTWATIAIGDLAVIASDTFLGNISGASAAPSAVNLSSLASTSLVYDATSHAFQRAPLTGAITSIQNSNATTFGALAAKSVLANATNASAVPAALAGTAAFQHLRVNSANTGLEWSVLTTGDFPANSVPMTALAQVGTDTFIGNITGALATPTATSLGSLASTSISYNSVAHQYQTAPITGVVAIGANGVTSAFTAAAPMSVLANANGVSTVPTYFAGANALEYLRRNAANNALEWGTLPASSLPTIQPGSFLGLQVDAAGAATAIEIVGSEAGENIRFDTRVLDTTSAGTFNAFVVAETTNNLTFNGTSAVILQGIAAPAKTGKVLFIQLGAASAGVTLPNESSSAAANNRIHCQRGIDITLRPNDNVMLVYQEVANGSFRWKMYSAPVGGALLRVLSPAAGTYTPSADCGFFVVELWGGGGGGGGAVAAASSAAVGSGGGGGGYCSFIVTTLAASYTVAIGAGGTAGSTAGGDGGTGGTTTFGTASAAGGVGGEGSANAARGSGSGTTFSMTGTGGLGGLGAVTVPSGGTVLNFGRGFPGMPGFRKSGTVGWGGAGGASGGGKGPSGGWNTSASASGNTGAAQSGSGGDGGFSNSTTGRAGGAGGLGSVRVWEYS